MKKDSSNWIEDLIETNGIERMDVPETLVKSLKAIPARYKNYKQRVSYLTIWMAAAGIILLLSINIKALKENSAMDQENSSLYTSYYSYLNQLR